MNESKRRVFLTGATGVMGMAGLKELSDRPEDYEVTLLARESKTNMKKLRPFIRKGVKVVWGDLLDEASMRRGIEGADIILHVGGMVSPLADLFPEKTEKVNIGSMKIITRLVSELESKDKEREIPVVYVGSVSQYGTKLPPNHWGKASDPQNPARGDVYAFTKVEAEKILRESGVRKWVSVRQTSILHGGLLKNASNPVAFHTPLNGVLEWITVEDSGRLLERLCHPDLPQNFWGKAYNVGGGEKFRKVNLEFERGIMKALGCPSPEKVFEPNWFATHNFHGMWFEDSDVLDDLLHYRLPGDSFEKALDRLKRALPWYFKMAPVVPAFIIKAFMKRVASHKELGPLSWVKNNDREKLDIFFGGEDAYKEIPGWKDFKYVSLDTSAPEVPEIDKSTGR